MWPRCVAGARRSPRRSTGPTRACMRHRRTTLAFSIGNAARMPKRIRCCGDASRSARRCLAITKTRSPTRSPTSGCHFAIWVASIKLKLSSSAAGRSTRLGPDPSTRSSHRRRRGRFADWLKAYQKAKNTCTTDTVALKTESVVVGLDRTSVISCAGCLCSAGTVARTPRAKNRASAACFIRKPPYIDPKHPTAEAQAANLAMLQLDQNS